MKASMHRGARAGTLLRTVFLVTAAAVVASLLPWVAPAAEAATPVSTVQAETLTRSGSTSASATGLTFYSNNDAAYGTVVFPDAGRYTITVDGSSSASNTAGISLLVDGVKQGSLTFTGTAYTDASATFDLATAGSKEVRLKLETDNGQNDTRVDYFTVSYVGPTPPLPAAPVPPTQGAYASGEYRDLFQEENPSLTQADIQAKLNTYWTSFFTGTDDTRRVYYPAGSNASGNLAYILDTGNSDIRSEGMSYGMMIAVEMDKKAEFDAIWNWAKTYMQQTTGPRTGYFCWDATTSGTCSDPNPASDGEEYFATALLFAGNRWGNGTGIYDYTTEGNAILNTMLHKEDMNGGVVGSITNMFNKTSKTVVFVPYASSANFSDPSYNLPAFYELWGRWATGWNGNQAADRQFWLDAATRSRQYFGQATNATTGLAPDYAEFTGAPNSTGNHGDFRFDAWRTAVNWSVDYSWWAADPNEKVLSDRLQAFFDGQGSTSYVNQYSLTGSPLSTDRSPGLIASNGAASLAATSQTAWKFVDALWNLQPPTGQYRYYDGLLNFMALLHASGSFKIYGPGSGTPDTVAPSAPTAVTTTGTTSTSVGLSWTAATDDRAVTGYTAYVGSSPTGATGCAAVTATSCTITGLSPNTAYSVTLKAVDAAGNTSTSSTALAVTTAPLSASPPAAPSGLSAIPRTSTGAVLTWDDDSSNETGFVIERKLGASGTWATLTTTPANATNYTDTGLTAGTQYVYRVHAVNGAGSSATSNEATAKPSAGAGSANRNAAYKIEAESFDDSSNVTVESADGGSVVNFASSASWVKFSGVNFGTTNVARAFFRALKTSSGGNLVLYIDNLTTARCTVYPDGNSTWAMKDNSCSPAFQGIHDVYIKPTGPVKVNYLYVTPQSTGTDAPALPASVTAAIASANAVDVTLYTPSSVATFVSAYVAETALTSDTASAAIATTTAALAAAQNSLVLKVDLTALRAAMATAAGLDASGFTPASWSTLSGALSTAAAINTSSPQAAVDGATSALQAAIAGLVPAGTPTDLSALQALLAAATSLQSTNYTSASWSALSAAVSDGAALTTASPQSTVDAAAATLQSALVGLVAIADLSALQTALAAAAVLDSSDYTASSWARLATAVSAAHALTGDSPQTAVDASAAAVQAAIAGLVPIADLGQLQSRLAEVAALDSSDYTDASWSALAAAAATGATLTGESPQARVDAAAAAIQAAIDGLVPATDLQPLEAKLAAAALLVASDYTSASWAVLADAVTDGQALTVSSAQTAVDAAAAAIAAAIEGLVPVSDVSALQAVLAVAAALNPPDYTSASWAHLATAVTAGLALTNQSSQSTVGAATAAIRSAISGLVPIADLDDLQAALSAVAALDSSHYTSGSWSAVSAATSDAQSLTTQSSQSAVDAATAAIRSAISGLVPVADLGELQLALSAAAALQSSAYTTTSWAPLATAVSAGLALTVTASQSEVDAATAAIRSAISGLVPVANLSGLQAALSAAGALSRSAYTVISWAPLADAVTAGQALTSQSPQSAVDAAAAAIRTAITGLVPVADLTQLGAALVAADALHDADYTSASWAGVRTAVVAGLALTGESSQSAVDAATAAIRSAVAGLVRVADLSGVQAAISAANALRSADYTTASWSALTAAVAAGGALPATSTQSAVDAATATIRSAISALVSVSVLGDLRAALSVADALQASDYTTASWSVLASAVAAGEAETPQSPQAAVDTATAAVQAAVAGLVRVADLSGLQAARSAAAALSSSGYTSSSWSVLAAAVSTAQPLTAQSPQSAVDAAAAGIRAAILGLVPVTVPLSNFSTVPRPTIAGTAQVGSSLSVNAGAWVPAAEHLSYQWRVAGVLAGTSATYAPVAADLGKTITVAVTGSKTGYRDATSAQSTATAKVIAGVLTATVPTVSGATCVGCVLTALPGAWGPAPVALAYQWLRDGKAISGATGATYTPTSADYQKRLSVVVTGTEIGFTTLAKTSAPTASIAAGTLTGTVAPIISGSPRIGSTLTATVTAWQPAPVTLSYQWLVNGATVKGATASTFIVPTTAQGALIEVWVTGAKTGYTSVVRTSDSVLVELSQFVTGVPTITGAATVGLTLTAAPGSWSPASGTKFSYQWYWEATSAGPASPIVGASQSTFTVPASANGRLLLVKVTAGRTGYASASQWSAPTAPVLGRLTTRTPTITGTAKVGKTLTAVATGWGPAGVQLSYQWVRVSGTVATPVPGATSATYVLTSADKGKSIQVRVGGALAGYASETLASSATDKVQ